MAGNRGPAMSAAAAGTAAAGAALGLGPRMLLAIGAGMILVTAAGTVLDRFATTGRRSSGTARRCSNLDTGVTPS
jgi:hypothetical protein